MNETRREEIRAMAAVLACLIESAEIQANSLREALEKLQGECNLEGHDKPEAYRGHPVGQCSICGQEFKDKSTIDKMSSR